MNGWCRAICPIFAIILSCAPRVASAVPGAPKQEKDARLLHKVTLHEKGVALSDFCAEVQSQTGVELSASRAVADEKVTVFVKERPARDVMREVARLLSDFWSRSGSEGKYRYMLDQDLKSQLAEEELRNRDQHAALLALDAEMQRYRPYLDVPFEELQKLSEQKGESAKALFDVVHHAGWAGMQAYFHLTPHDRAALAAGQEVVFRADAPDQDHRLPAEWEGPILHSWQTNLSVMLDHSEVNFSQDQLKLAPVADLPGMRVFLVQLKLNHSELGEVALDAAVSAVYAKGSMYVPTRMATGRSPSAENPANASVNAALKGQPPFDQVVTLRPEPSCAPSSQVRPGSAALLRTTATAEARQSVRVTSADVWEAIHRATGLPVVADFYTGLYPAGKVTVGRRLLFESLCDVADAMGARWTRDDGYLLGRSTSYFWDKLKEVPNRYLRH